MIASPTFADLQRLYLLEVPELMTSEPVVRTAESAARNYRNSGPEKRVAEVVNAVYRAQLKALMKQCKSRWKGEQKPLEMEASGIIEDSYARVLAHTNLRYDEDQQLSERLLPTIFSKNLTTRVSVIGLSLSCSSATPGIASLLSEAGIPCGSIQNQSEH